MTLDDRVTHGDLPHWYKPGHAHFITYRLANTIPVTKLAEWRMERELKIQHGEDAGRSRFGNRMSAHKQFFSRYDDFLDGNRRVRWLADHRVSAVIRENLYHHHGRKYELLCYCIMPNHVHVLLQPFATVGQAASLPVQSVEADEDGNVPKLAASATGASATGEVLFSDECPDGKSPLTDIMHSLKSYTANRANAVLERTGQFWQHESYDHWVRDIEELERIVDYIRHNPVRAGLCASPEEWLASSSADRFQSDGSVCGLVSWLRDDWRRCQ